MYICIYTNTYTHIHTRVYIHIDSHVNIPGARSPWPSPASPPRHPAYEPNADGISYTTPEGPGQTGSKNHTMNVFWGPESLDIESLDPLGNKGDGVASDVRCMEQTDLRAYFGGEKEPVPKGSTYNRSR